LGTCSVFILIGKGLSSAGSSPAVENMNFWLLFVRQSAVFWQKFRFFSTKHATGGTLHLIFVTFAGVTGTPVFIEIKPDSLFDAPLPWQCTFQDPATIGMEGILDLHHEMMFFLIVIVLFIF
jgi:hypothetical protein